ncbi:MAG: SGNH/GDSL hydrolase family protein [Bradyrhizobiaceae bacterium]|nr:SGNH/GDSL hydrolase family protein [Bradyrhizobiaceae bacterium]
MRPIVVALLCALTFASAVAKDGEANECIEAAGSIAPDFALPAVAKAIAGKKLDIAVIGSASSELNGPAGTNIAYPTALERGLRSVLPGVAVTVTTYARPRETASEMQARIAHILGESKPALVIWQTGTADALRGIDPDEFRASLDDGIDKLHAAGADVVFVNMQYSPRIEAMLAVTPYADAMRYVAMQHEVVLFDRFDIMKRWNESGIFDLYGATRSTNVAEKVHGCLGRLLADAVIEGARMAPPPPPPTKNVN